MLTKQEFKYKISDEEIVVTFKRELHESSIDNWTEDFLTIKKSKTEDNWTEDFLTIKKGKTELVLKDDEIKEFRKIIQNTKFIFTDQN